MPIAAIERLNRKSSKGAIQKAISACISEMHDAHPDWDDDRITAACYSMARSRCGVAKVPKK